MAIATSRLAETIKRLESCSGAFYFYEPREYLRSTVEPWSSYWQAVSPNEAESLGWGELDNYSLQLCSSLTGSIGLSPLDAVGKIANKRLWQAVTLLWVPDHCQGGDYGGGTHNLSNSQALLEEFGGSPACRELIGSHGSYGLAIDPRYAGDDLLEALESLEGYPVWDEDHLAHIEEDLKVEAFSSWVESDLRGLLESTICDALIERGEPEEISEKRSEQIAEDATESQLWEILGAADRDRCLWSAEHNAMWCDLRRVDVEAILGVLLP